MMRLMLLTALACSACEAPPVFAGERGDERQKGPTLGRIEGQVIVNTATRGRIVLFLYDAARPPPPVGTGRPLTFTVVSREAVFGSALDGDTGPFTAPFAFSLRGPGRYLIRGFVDSNDDFIPWYGVTADTTRGDVGGAAIDPLTRASRVVEIGVDEAGQPIPALDVPVSFSDAAKLPLDRPIFSVVGGLESIMLNGQPRVIELQATPIDEGVMNQPTPAFLVRFIDDNADGVPDDANGDGIPEVWPRVVVRKIQPGLNPLIDENDVDKNGVVDAKSGTTLSYEHANAPDDTEPDVVVLAAGFDVTEYAPSLVDAMGRVKTTPTAVPRLKLVLQPRAFDVVNPTAPQPIRAVPIGRYAITVIQQTGQTWRVPNELGLNVAGLPLVSSQSFVIQVQ